MHTYRVSVLRFRLYQAWGFRLSCARVKVQVLSRTAFSFHLCAGSKPRVRLENPVATFQNLIRGLLGMTPSLWDTLQNRSFAGAKPTVPLVFRIIRLVQHLLQLHLSGRWPRSLCILKNGAISDSWWFGVWDLRVPSARFPVRGFRFRAYDTGKAWFFAVGFLRLRPASSLKCSLIVALRRTPNLSTLDPE